MSTEEVIKVMVESASDEEIEEPPTLSEVLERSLEEFKAIKSSINVYSAFCEEATASLKSVYYRHEIHSSPRENLLNMPVNLGPIIASEILVWLKMIRRRMLPTLKSSNPWFIHLKRGLSKDVFMRMREIVLCSPSMFGIAVEGETINFTNKNRMIRDFSYLGAVSKSYIKEQICKTFKGKRKGCHAELVICASKPFVMLYDNRKCEVEIQIHYGFWNEFGYAFHN